MRVSNIRTVFLEKSVTTGSTAESPFTLEPHENAIIAVLPDGNQDVTLKIATQAQPTRFIYAQKSNWSSDPRATLNTTQVMKDMVAQWENSSGSTVVCRVAILVGTID